MFEKLDLCSPPFLCSLISKSDRTTFFSGNFWTRQTLQLYILTFRCTFNLCTRLFYSPAAVFYHVHISIHRSNCVSVRRSQWDPVKPELCRMLFLFQNPIIICHMSLTMERKFRDSWSRDSHLLSRTILMKYCWLVSFSAFVSLMALQSRWGGWRGHLRDRKWDRKD